MGYISVIAQKGSQMLFSVPEYNVYFSMPVSELPKISPLSFEWFEEYLPSTPYDPYEILLLSDGSVRDR